MINLSIIVPCYNEADSLERLFNCCKESCNNRTDIEFVFVNNGSTDSTQEIMDGLLTNKEYSFGKSVHVKINKGYGYGILQGLAIANGEILSWTHADLQTDPKDVIRGYDLFKKQLCSNTCIVKGARKGRNLFDVFFTAGMSIIASILLGTKLNDINAQPKMFHKEFMKLLKNAPHDFSLDLYVLYTAARSGITCQEMSVYFNKREFGTAKGGGTLKGKFNLIKRTFSYIFELRQAITKGIR